MSLWRRLREALFPVAPPLPSLPSEQVLTYLAERAQADVARAEREAAEQMARLHQLERRLQLYERSGDTDGTEPPHDPSAGDD